MDTPLDHNIKGYEVKQRIGAGGFGAVYRAQQTTIGREVAIKIILPGLANQPEFIRRFEGEAQLVARLEHPHITPLYDYWRDPEGAYLVMRWLRGGSLRDALQNGPFELRTAALLLDQIAGALSLAHRSGVIHRDIKPGNILLDEDGNAYLTDFGIAKDLNVTSVNTQQDTIIGSLDYISPEQARSEPVTARTDIYSLGVTIFEVLTGHHPFENMSSIERLYKHINDALPEITTLDNAVGAEVNRVIQKATAKNPEQRYTDALAFAADFREAIGLNRTSTSMVELLTQREHEILQLIIEGLSNKEIAQRLTITLGTVKWYVNQIYSKMGVRSRVQAIVRARELNLIGRPVDSLPTIIDVSEDFQPENPYKGLRAFQSADYEDFFGREKVTAQLVKRIGDTSEYGRFLAVVGPSGSGKSSLVKAGLIPAIWRGDLTGSEKWFVAEMLPGPRPLDELEIALTKMAANQAGNLRDQLQRDRFGLVRAAALILPNDGSELLLVIDQFEEVFTLLEDETARSHFLDLLYAAVTESRTRVRVVITLRADFYDRPLHYTQFGELVRQRLETIMPLSAEELERAIIKPTEQASMTFEPGLVAAMIADVNYQPGALPLLQYALTELFEQRQGRVLTREAYQSIGGIVGALAQRAETVYQTLNADQQELVRQLFLRLVTLGEGTEDTRRRTPHAELLAIAADRDELDEIIDTFASYRLLALDTDPGTRTPTVEVAHEALLREWERLRGWLNESRDEIKLQRQLSAMAAEWYAAKRDASFLARGTRLAQFESWAKDTNLALIDTERVYLEASLAERGRERSAEQERQAREAKLERRSQNFLRGLVAVMALALVVAIGLTGFAVNQSQIAENNAALAQENADYARSIALASGAENALASNNPEQAIALAVAANTSTDNPPAIAQSVLYETAFVPSTRDVISIENSYQEAISFDGTRMLSWTQDSTQFIYIDVSSGQTLQRWTPEFLNGMTVLNVIFALDGTTAYAVLGSSNEPTTDLVEFDVTTGQEIRRFELPEAPVRLHEWAMTVSSDGQTLAIGTEQPAHVYTWDTASGELSGQFADASLDTGELAWSVNISADGQQMLVGYDTGLIALWDISTGDLVRTFQGPVGWVMNVFFTPHGIISAHTNWDEYTSAVVLWNADTGEMVHQQTWDSPLITSSLSSDGSAFAAGYISPVVNVLDTQTLQVTHELYGHNGSVYTVTFMRDEPVLISTARDQTVRLWKLQDDSEIQRFEGSTGFLAALLISPEGDTMLTQEYNGPVSLWDLATGAVIRELGNTQNYFRSVAFSPDGEHVVTGTGIMPQTCPAPPGELTLTNAQSGDIVWQAHRAGGYVNSNIAFIQAGAQILTVDWSCDNNITVWDAATGEEVAVWSGHQAPIWAVAASPDGRFAASGSNDQTAILWDQSTGTSIHTLPHEASVETVVFSPDSSKLLTISRTGLLTIWDTQTGNTLHEFTGHTASAIFAQFSPDGRYIVSGGSDNNIFVWDLQIGQVVREFNLSLVSPLGSAVAFSSDGQSILMSDENNVIRQIDLMLQPGQLLEWVRENRYIPELTCQQRTLYRLEPLCDNTADL